MNVFLATAVSIANTPLEFGPVQALHVYMELLVIVIKVIGVAAISWGVFCSLFKWAHMEWVTIQGMGSRQLREMLRHHLGYYILLGLEFLVAADIIETLMSPTWEHLGILAGIVVIRIVISYSLNWELSQSEDSPKDSKSKQHATKEPAHG
jgi:uncharacterized membrane protein